MMLGWGRDGGRGCWKVRWTWTSNEQAMLQARSITESVQVGGRLQLP